MRALQDQITATVQPVIEAATPGSGAYMNEADFQRPHFQEAFYGSNYGRLRAIKNVLDPDGLLYGHTAVGSEMWTVAEDGRMCKTL
ncbi:FAD fmn-containing isoamyl alcohol oxidase [Grosmannia clavigera kw1407]|uniref:FAD fmn-containing isoamyl alcohol oxidase n=1 Tax=Grosmannia clavigera (strain kw1407 / UAMH 11150) TaxID=655863 RepID=F0XRK8_GROCL|nr:FAD fmn-containing isoamyl alcohol oxidase [Grosmannia clavigera kw1407]EFW99679.1 FAD fmn-containing isoamyl alcohol oxidase [Grosmannia clavigera kw1407]